MPWLLAQPPKLTESLPEWLKGVARDHLFKDLASFTAALGFENCTSERLFFDPPLDLIDLISQKTSVPVEELIRRTAKYSEVISNNISEGIGDFSRRRMVGILTYDDLKKDNGRNKILGNCDMIYGFRHITSKRSIVSCILNGIMEDFGGWSVIVPSRDQLPLRWNVVAEMADKLLNKDIVLQTVLPKIIFSRIYINSMMNDNMRKRAGARLRRKIQMGPI